MQTRNKRIKSVPVAAILLAIPGLVLSQVTPFNQYASLLWLASGVFIAIAMISAIAIFRGSKTG
jgi:hypothetical protein